MDPVFALQWSEYVVCDRLQKLCPKSEGFSVYIPVSRQEKGVDIGLLHRNKGLRRMITIQVKSSRTYPGTPAKNKKIVRYKYYTWFNRFDPSPDADYFALIGFFPREADQTTKIGPSWYHDCILLLSNKEMKELIDNCNTVGGKQDRMFGFGFNDLSSIIYTRGDQNRSGKDFSQHLIDRKIKDIKNEG
jgi:hypothetical protein